MKNYYIRMSSNSTTFKLQIMESSQLFHELWGNTYILLAYFLLYEGQQAMEKNINNILQMYESDQQFFTIRWSTRVD